VTKHGQIFADAFLKCSLIFAIAPFDHYTAYIEILKPISDRTIMVLAWSTLRAAPIFWDLISHYKHYNVTDLE